MRLKTIVQFEIAHQLRRRSTWVYVTVVLGLTFAVAAGSFLKNARTDGYLFNGAFVVAGVSVIAAMAGLLVTAAVAGDAATRDLQERMEALLYTTPMTKAEYVAGRFLGAFSISAMVMAAVPIGLIVAAHLPGIEPELVGRFRPTTYVRPYLILALPDAFVATALLFSVALLSGRALASYIGAATLFLAATLGDSVVAQRLGHWALGKAIDPLGITVLSELSRLWTPLQKSTLTIGMERSLLLNRLLWMAIGATALGVTHRRFRLAQGIRLRAGRTATPGEGTASRPGETSSAEPAFGAGTVVRQTLAVTLRSLREIVTSRGTIAVAVSAAGIVLTAPAMMRHFGVPMLPTTGRLSTLFMSSGDLFWIIPPLFTAFCAGELVWRERDAGMSALVDTAAITEPVLMAAKLLSLTLALAFLQAVVMLAGVAAQSAAGYYRHEFGLYLKILFGLELPGYVLFAALAMAVHAAVNQKHVANLVLMIAIGFIAYPSIAGVEHTLLVYGSDPGWRHSDMRGFGAAILPFIAFKVYWTGWAMLVTGAAALLWPRGARRRIRARVRSARRRFSPAAAWTFATAAAVIAVAGGFIFYNTNVLNSYRSTAQVSEARAEYERRYRRYEALPQPRLTRTSLRLELYPARGAAVLRGTSFLENKESVAIDTIHVDTPADAETVSVGMDRPFSTLLSDDELRHRIYALRQPLRPGESLQLSFEVRRERRGFTNVPPDTGIAANGSRVGQELVPQIGYQRSRELSDRDERRRHGLSPLNAARSDDEAGGAAAGRERIAFNAVVGTAPDQVAVAPGTLRRTWTARGRRYFHYVADAPIRNSYAFYSARYARHEARWNDVVIEIFHHPDHTRNLDRMTRSVQSALSSYAERFGRYPYRQLRLVEAPGSGVGMHSDPIDIAYSEGFSELNPAADPRHLDFVFAVVAHEVAHQWWGNQLTPAAGPGAPLLTETLAWYSAMEVVERVNGPAELRRLVEALREEYRSPRARAGVPLLEAADWFVAYRKGPFAMLALRDSLGKAPVDHALRRLFERHASETSPLPTSFDLYRELQAVTPASMRPLLADLFEVNTFWDLSMKAARAEPAGARWRVTLSISARKFAVDRAGTERARPMDDLIDVAVFGDDGAPLYLRKHRIRSGETRVTITVPARPQRAGIDPNGILIDTSTRDNVVEVRQEAIRQSALPRGALESKIRGTAAPLHVTMQGAADSGV